MTSDTFRSGLIPACLALAAVFLLGSCQSAYYGAMEKVGVHKRDLLVKRVAASRDEQEEAKEQFTSALDAFMAVVEVEPSELESQYKRLNKQLENSEDAAERVRDRIDSVEDVAEALFREWENELEMYSSPQLRRSSEDQLRDTRRRYEQLIDAMHRAESRMEPVLVAFRDQVLYLKHNLNAQAIASLQNEVSVLESEIENLVREMQAAIDEATSFIDAMEGEAV